MTATLLRGEPIAASVRENVSDRVRVLVDRGHVPTLGTVLMSAEPADERFLDLKHDTCADVGIATRDIRIDPDAPASRLYRAIDELCADPAVDAVFVQVPLPEHVSLASVRERIDPPKDIDCFHPETLGRLVAGTPRFVPATPAAVCRLLAHYDLQIAGSDIVIVGRSSVIGRPLANLLLRDRSAAVTVCHSRTHSLGSQTRRGEMVITAAGTPGLVDGSMLAPEAVVVDVSATRQPAAEGSSTTVVGDVAFQSARQTVRAITPVPGGIGPVTLAMVAANVIRAAETRAENQP